MLQLIHYSNDIRKDAFNNRAYIFVRQQNELSLTVFLLKRFFA